MEAASGGGHGLAVSWGHPSSSPLILNCITSGDAIQKAADAHRMMVWGNLIDLSQEAEQRAEDAPKVRDNGHELVVITAQGVQSMARNVLAFDVADGNVAYYSNGHGVYRLEHGHSTKIAGIREVEQLSILR
jgi:hypothetical protein